MITTQGIRILQLPYTNDIFYALGTCLGTCLGSVSEVLASRFLGRLWRNKTYAKPFNTPYKLIQADESLTERL